MYVASNISFRAGNRELLRNIGLTIRPGEFTAVVGPNGAGKSTLLKVLANEHTAHTGAVDINGRAMRLYSPRELSLVRAVLSQHSDVHFAFTVDEIVQLGRYPHKGTRAMHQAVVDEVMEVTGITEFANRNYQTLSGGEKQRVQLARVLAQVWEETVYPRYILLDEPTSSLDIAQQQVIFSLAKKVCGRNIGVMAIVHDLNQAVQFANQLYFMRDGHIVSSGDALKVFTKSTIEETFCCKVNVYHDPCNNCPYIVPERMVHNETHKLKLINQKS